MSYTLVGLFVLVLGAALATAVFWLAAGGRGKVYDTYVSYMTESVSGLNPQASVKYRGVDVGRVRQIAIDTENPERIRLLMDIEEGTPVKQDTRAVLATQGITGLAYVDLTGGSRDSPLLTATSGEYYPEIPTGPSLLVRLDTMVSDLFLQLSTAAVELNRVAERVSLLLGDDNQARIAATLASVEQLTGALAARTDSLEATFDHLNRMLANGARASEALPGALAQVGDTAGALRRAVTTIDRAAAGVDGMVRRAEQELVRSSGDTMVQVGNVLGELQQLAQTLRLLGQQLQQDPNMLLFGRGNIQPGPGEGRR